MVTLKDIAERAGVSMMTVSRVMNSKEGKYLKNCIKNSFSRG